MIQPIRPQDVSGVYRQQAISGAPTPPAGIPADAPSRARAVARRTDQVELSDGARQLQTLLDAVRALPDVRADRIAFLRDQVAAGAYDIDAATVAQRLVEQGLA